MKSIEQIYSEFVEAAVTSGKVTSNEITEVVSKLKSEANDPTVEMRLSTVKKFAESKGFKDGARRKIVRNNGSGGVVTESDAERVAEYMQNAKCDFREAAMICGVDPSTIKESDIITARAERWKAYAPWLLESECQKLASMGKEPQ